MGQIKYCKLHIVTAIKRTVMSTHERPIPITHNGNDLKPNEDEADVSEENVLAEKLRLQDLLAQKNKQIEELKSSLPETKKSNKELDDLIVKWRNVCQESLLELHGKLQMDVQKPSMS